MPLTAHRPSQHLIDLVGALDGIWHGRMAMCKCPAHADTTPSLSLRQGDRGILVTCFAGCDRHDVLRELSRIRLGRHYPAPTFNAPNGRANIDRLWSEALPIAGTLGERYLARRYLTLPIDDVRFHPRCPHRPKPFTAFKPAILVAVREGRTLTALQRIFIDPASGWYETKVMIGTPGGGAWPGGGSTRTLGIAEGFETAAAFTRLHDIACWASLGARRLDQLILPHNIETLLIAEDNDLEGSRAAGKAWAAYKPLGILIRRMPPPRRFGDWAEVLEHHERGGGSGRVTLARGGE